MLLDKTTEHTDMMGRTIVLPNHPLTIVSIVPSQTELLVDLGLEDQILGITKFCIHPEYIFRSKPRVGGTKQLNFEEIRALKPDVIIANKEENQQSQIEALAKEFPVWISDIYTLNDALDMIKQLGILFNVSEKAEQMIHEISIGFSGLKALTKPLNCAYFIWRKPYMVAAQNTFINHILLKLGFTNCFENTNDSRYPEIKEDVLNQAQPEVVFLSSEPYPFKEQHIDELQHIWPNSTIKLVDGEYFSWYGSRLLGASKYFNNLISELHNSHKNN